MTPPAEHDLRALRDWREDVRADALALGFSLVGFTTADPLDDRHQRRWDRALAQDRFGEMDYLRRIRPRRTHPSDLLEQAQALIVVAVSYFEGDHPEISPLAISSPVGKVARYAWGEDYHHLLRDRLSELGKGIANAAPAHGWLSPVSWRAVADSAPLDERAFAERAGLGFIGKNTLLLHPRHGSWIVLGALLISIPFPPDDPIEGTCGACRKCLDACPTGAFPRPYELDPTRCISYLTIEQKAEIPPDLIPKLDGWAFGCDICQEVCPYNQTPLPRILPELAPDHGNGPLLKSSEIDTIASGKSFERRFATSPLRRARLKGIRRNLAALANPSDSLGGRDLTAGPPPHSPQPASTPNPVR